MSITPENQTLEQLQQRFSALTSWQQKYREVMLLGKTVPALPEPLKVDDAKVNGCESNVWLYIDYHHNEGTLAIIGDSDTRIVKGLLALVLFIYNGKTPQQIIELEGKAIFDQLGLSQHLSPSRNNGVLAIITTIEQQAQRLV